MKHYYIINSQAENGFDEVSEEEFLSIVGDESVRAYTDKVYKGIMSINEVPEELRSKVEEVVSNRIAKYGDYEDSNISSSELQSMIEGVL